MAHASGDSIQDQLAVKQKRHGGRVWQGKAVHIMAARKHREKARAREGQECYLPPGLSSSDPPPTKTHLLTIHSILQSNHLPKALALNT